RAPATRACRCRAQTESLPGTRAGCTAPGPGNGSGAAGRPESAPAAPTSHQKPATATAVSVPHAADVNDQIELSYQHDSPPTPRSLLNLRSVPDPVAPARLAPDTPHAEPAEVHCGDQLDARAEQTSSKAEGSTPAEPPMEPLWSPVVAIGGNHRQNAQGRKPQKQAKSVATGCHRLPATFHGKEGVSGSSSGRGL